MSWRFPSVVEWTEEAQQERIAVGGPKFIQSFIKERADLLPAAFRIVVFHGGGLLIAPETNDKGTDRGFLRGFLSVEPSGSCHYSGRANGWQELIRDSD